MRAGARASEGDSEGACSNTGNSGARAGKAIHEAKVTVKAPLGQGTTVAKMTQGHSLKKVAIRGYFYIHTGHLFKTGTLV